jgi:hypothetical protein
VIGLEAIVGDAFEKTEEGLKFWGVYKLMVGVLAAAESLLGILRSANPPEMSIWGPLTIAAAVLLAIDGLADLFVNVNRWLFVALGAIVPIAISILSDEWPVRLWIFAVAVGFAEWVFLELRRSTGRTEIGSLACCAALACSLANTTFMIFRQYWDAPQFWPLGQIFRFMLPIALPWTLIAILLLHSARELIASRKERADGPLLASEAADES